MHQQKFRSHNNVVESKPCLTYESLYPRFADLHYAIITSSHQNFYAPNFKALMFDN